MLLYPDVLRRAQAEIDAVIGSDRLPTFEDRPNLPYVDAVLKESLRWHNVLPIDVPHVSTLDDNYRGYHIPSGSLVLVNIWQLTHDPENYHDPMDFKPERFLGVDGRALEPDPRTLVFGFGRRICPGKELIDASVFIWIAMSIAVFDIRKAKDEFGREIEPRVEFSSGVISHPKEFPYSITPRSAKAAALIQAVEDEHPFETSDAQKLDGLRWR